MLRLLGRWVCGRYRCGHQRLALVWFDSSNPFRELALDGADLLAPSTLGCRWRFPLADPASCSVVCLD